jgi:hypothetical protein
MRSGSTKQASIVQFPDSSTIPVPIVALFPSVTVNRDPGSPVPLRFGVESPVILPFIGEEIVSGLGIIVSILISKLSPIIVFPAGSVIVGVTDVIPSESHELGLQITVPDITGVGVHVHPEIVTVDPISAESTTSGVESLVRYGVVVSPEIEVILGASGAVVSIVKSTIAAGLCP